MNYDTIILGSGPAGLTCGIYTSRARLKTLIVDFLLSPSQITLTDIIENYPGFPEGISGYELQSKMKLQAEKFGCEFVSTSVSPEIIDYDDIKRIFKIKINDSVYYTKTVVIATGRSWKHLGIENETKFIGRGISYCGTCDAAFFKNRSVVVVGGGDTALQESLFISKFVKKLFLVHRRKEFRGTKILQERLFGRNNVEIITPAVIKKFLGEDKIVGVEIEFVDTKIMKTLDCDGIFIFVGEKPNTEFLKVFTKNISGKEIFFR